MALNPLHTQPTKYYSYAALGQRNQVKERKGEKYAIGISVSLFRIFRFFHFFLLFFFFAPSTRLGCKLNWNSMALSLTPPQVVCLLSIAVYIKVVHGSAQLSCHHHHPGALGAHFRVPFPRINVNFISFRPRFFFLRFSCCCCFFFALAKISRRTATTTTTTTPNRSLFDEPIDLEFSLGHIQIHTHIHAIIHMHTDRKRCKALL